MQLKTEVLCTPSSAWWLFKHGASCTDHLHILTIPFSAHFFLYQILCFISNWKFQRIDNVSLYIALLPVDIIFVHSTTSSSMIVHCTWYICFNDWININKHLSCCQREAQLLPWYHALWYCLCLGLLHCTISSVWYHYQWTKAWCKLVCLTDIFLHGVILLFFYICVYEKHWLLIFCPGGFQHKIYSCLQHRHSMVYDHWSIKVFIVAQTFATSTCITDCKGSNTTWELRMCALQPARTTWTFSCMAFFQSVFI